MGMLEIINSRGSAGWRILGVLLYCDLPCMTKTHEGKIIIESMSDLYSSMNTNPSYFRSYLMHLEHMGIVTKLIFKYNYCSFYIVKPPMFNYSE